MTDFHSHLLPGIDDGSDSVETSLAMLELWREQGISRVCAAIIKIAITAFASIPRW